MITNIVEKTVTTAAIIDAQDPGRFPDSANQSLGEIKQSYLKKEIAQAQNGTAVTDVGSNQPPIRIEIPPCCDFIPFQERCYNLQMNRGQNYEHAVANTAGAINIDTVQYWLPATYVSEFQKLEYYFVGSTTKWVDQSAIANYSKEKASLFNNFRKRIGKQRFCFAYDKEYDEIRSSTNNDDGTITNHNPIYGQGSWYLDSLGDATGRTAGAPAVEYALVRNGDNIIEKPTVNDYMHKFIPLLDFQMQNRLVADGGANRTGTLRRVPKKYSFNYKEADLLPESIFSRGKYLPHSTNAVSVTQFDTIGNIIYEQPIRIVLSDANNRQITSITPTGYLRPLSSNQVMTVDNFFLKYYAECNPKISDPLMMGEMEVVYPVIVPGGTQLSSQLNSATVTLAAEFPNRLYRISSSLYSNFSATNLPVVHNNENIDLNKWDGDVDIMFNNDVLATFNASNPNSASANGTGVDDWFEYIIGKFVDGSINSRKELQYNGTIIYDMDTSSIAGHKDEFKDNALKGKILNQTMNLTVRFKNAKYSDGNRTYIHNVSLTYLKKAIIKGGVMINLVSAV